MSAQKLHITRLGGQGDGIAETPQGQIFVPFTLPGDLVNAAVEKSRATLMAVLEPSADRVTPPCPHFGPDLENAGCGGCAVQHMADAPYRAWKRGLVVAALEGRGIMAEVGPLVASAPGSRRRVVFAARRTDKGAILGFNRALSHQIVPIETCVIATPRINQALPSIRRLATAVAVGKEAFHLSVLDALPGLDVAVEAPFKLSEPDRLRIITAART
ncbi:MAG: RNA methyltransferase, partial [Hoeflea sp.]|nr:RNA methyltransferase [Hoeflea sp.]